MKKIKWQLVVALVVMLCSGLWLVTAQSPESPSTGCSGLIVHDCIRCYTVYWWNWGWHSYQYCINWGASCDLKACDGGFTVKPADLQRFEELTP